MLPNAAGDKDDISTLKWKIYTIVRCVASSDISPDSILSLIKKKHSQDFNINFD